MGPSFVSVEPSLGPSSALDPQLRIESEQHTPRPNIERRIMNVSLEPLKRSRMHARARRSAPSPSLMLGPNERFRQSLSERQFVACPDASEVVRIDRVQGELYGARFE